MSKPQLTNPTNEQELREQGGGTPIIMDTRTKVCFYLQQIGILPYPEIVEPFMAVVTNSATKEQIDRVDTLLKPLRPKARNLLAELYDELNEEVK